MSYKLWILLLLPFISRAQEDPVLYSVYAIGNTGVDTIPSPAIQLMAFESFDDSLSTIVLLGNVSGKEGQHSRDTQRETVMNSQYLLFTAYQGRLHLVPGVAEWKSARMGGESTNENCRNYTNNWFKEKGIIRNRNTAAYMATPGPEKIQVRKGISLISIDSQWWLQQGIITSKRRKQKRVLAQLDSLCNQARMQGDLIILAAHHPLISNGKRIHHKQPLRFLINFTPLKLFSLFGLDRGLRQDLNQPRYRRYRSSIRSVISKYPGIIYLSAHEYNMQYLIQDGIYHVISGSGAETKQIDRYRYPAKFMDDLQAGFFRITVHRSGNVYLHAYGANDRGEYWKTLMFTHPKSIEF